ncbi:MAG: dockerin type I domain-containing protein [Porcipelethomonas sp.]
MKAFKKTVATLITIIATFSSTYATVGAYEYVMDYDVNMDYSVNVRDVVYINKILSGQCKASNPEYLDVNGNGIADEVDSRIILYYITGKSVYYSQA